jgi:hypothetical protein
MPRRVSSDDEEPQPKKKKTARKGKGVAGASVSGKKGRSIRNESDTVISSWANRRTVESLEGIEDIDVISPKKGRQKPAFEIDNGILLRRSWLIVDIERIPAVAQLAVHKKKIAEVSNWLKEFPHHRKVGFQILFHD